MDYVNHFNPGAAIILKDKIKQQCKRLADFPTMGLLNRDELASGLRSFFVEDYLKIYQL